MRPKPSTQQQLAAAMNTADTRCVYDPRDPNTFVERELAQRFGEEDLWISIDLEKEAEFIRRTPKHLIKLLSLAGWYLDADNISQALTALKRKQRTEHKRPIYITIYANKFAHSMLNTNHGWV